MGSERLRMGIIGCGEIAAATAKGIQEAEHAKIAAVMDTNEAPAEDLGRTYDVPWTTDAAELLAHSDHPDGPARCFVEHAAAVPFGNSQVAVVVLLLSCNGWVEQLAGSAVVAGDDRHAMVRATLAAVNRRLEALLSR